MLYHAVDMSQQVQTAIVALQNIVTFIKLLAKIVKSRDSRWTVVFWFEWSVIP